MTKPTIREMYNESQANSPYDADAHYVWGVFHQLYVVTQTHEPDEDPEYVLPWLTEDVAYALDVDYLETQSGDKLLSDLAYRFAPIPPTTLKRLTFWVRMCKIILAQYYSKWQRMYEIYSYEYTPADNYNMHETVTPDLINKSNSKTKTDYTNTESNDNYGFNSANPVPTSKTTIRTQGDANNNTVDTETTQKGSTTTERYGNIGVTTTQQMLQSDIELWKWNFFTDVIYKDIDSIIVDNIYYFN